MPFVPACSQEPDTSPGGHMAIPEPHSGLWKRLLETWINSVTAVPTDLQPLPDPDRSNSQNAAALLVSKTF